MTDNNLKKLKDEMDHLLYLKSDMESIKTILYCIRMIGYNLGMARISLNIKKLSSDKEDEISCDIQLNGYESDSKEQIKLLLDSLEDFHQKKFDKLNEEFEGIHVNL